MATTIGWKSGLDVLAWRGLNSHVLFAPSSQGNSGFDSCCDLRNDASRDPFVYFMTSGSVFDTNSAGFGRYNPIYDTFDKLQNAGTFPITTLNVTVRSSSMLVQQPSRGPRGTITSQSSDKRALVLSTALPQAVIVNQLANRGDGVGYKIRIIGNSSGGNGKTEEHFIIANTAGTQPTLILAEATTATFQVGDAYEILSGRVYSFTATASNGRYYDIATGFIGTQSSTSGPALSADACGICLDETMVPATRAPGDGFFGNIVATAIAAGSITGTVAGVDSALIANEYRNFQIRVVQDTGTPTAVGQRRKIASHTGGASPVYTLASNWTVTPSATATFVIEYANEIIILHPGSTNTFTYVSDANGSQTADTWSTTTYGARSTAGAAGCNVTGMWGAAPTYDLISSPTAKQSHPSFFIFFRGGGYNQDLLDIAGGANGTWTNTLSLDHGRVNNGVNALALLTGARLLYDPATLGGRYCHILVGQTSDLPVLTQATPSCFVMRYDVISRQFLGTIGIPSQFVGISTASKLFWLNFFIDGSTKIARLGILGSPAQTTNFAPAVPHLCMDLLV